MFFFKKKIPAGRIQICKILQFSDFKIQKLDMSKKYFLWHQFWITFVIQNWHHKKDFCDIEHAMVAEVMWWWWGGGGGRKKSMMAKWQHCIAISTINNKKTYKECNNQPTMLVKKKEKNFNIFIIFFII